MYIAQSQRQHSVCVGDCSRTAVKQTRMNMLQLKCDNMAPTYLHVFAERDDRWLRNCPKYQDIGQIPRKWGSLPGNWDKYPESFPNNQKSVKIPRTRSKYPELAKIHGNYPSKYPKIGQNTRKLSQIPRHGPNTNSLKLTKLAQILRN